MIAAPINCPPAIASGSVSITEGRTGTIERNQAAGLFEVIASNTPSAGTTFRSPTRGTSATEASLVGPELRQSDAKQLKTTAPGSHLDLAGQNILRRHFVNEILRSIDGLRSNAHTSAGAMHFGNLLASAKNFTSTCPNDPYTSIVQALVDALAHHNQWIQYGPDQYSLASKLLRDSALVQDLTTNITEKAILKLEGHGFNTTAIADSLDNIFDDDE
jgi:hypothetical protein